jgi:hypothetical protein
MKPTLLLVAILLLAPLAAPMIGSFTVASAVEPFCTETCGPTRALGVLKPGKPVPLDEGFRDPPSKGSAALPSKTPRTCRGIRTPNTLPTSTT